MKFTSTSAYHMIYRYSLINKIYTVFPQIFYVSETIADHNHLLNFRNNQSF